MKINKIQVLIPGGGYFGGIESLHQLVSEAYKLGINITCVYIPLKNMFYKDYRFKKNLNLNSYSIKIDDKIEDNKNTCIIIPETFTSYIRVINQAQTAIWWLSKDNFFDKEIFYNDKSIKNSFKKIVVNLLSNFKNNKLNIFLFLAHYMRPLTLLEIKQKKIIHLCQSYYVFNFLKKKRFNNLLYMHDYISTRNYKVYKKTIDVILNSNKGKKYNQLFIKNYKDILNIFTLKNLNLTQTQKKLNSSKLFIDFGHHPGRDRIPREAVLQNTNILVKKIGAANNKKDLNVDDRNKFKSYNIYTDLNIIKKLTIYNSLKSSKKEYNSYLRKINNDKKLMIKEIKNFIKKIRYERK